MLFLHLVGFRLVDVEQYVGKASQLAAVPAGERDAFRAQSMGDDHGAGDVFRVAGGGDAQEARRRALRRP